MTTAQRAAARVIDAWDSTVLPVANDGRLQEAMEDLRAALAAMADTPTLREAAQQALVALEAAERLYRQGLLHAHPALFEHVQTSRAASITALRAALAEQAEPVAVPAGYALVRTPITEEMHVAAAKVLVRANGLDGTPQRMLDAMIAAAPPAPARQEPPADWSVFNTGAEVAGGLTYAEALDYLTPARLERGWSAVCVVNKDNITAAPPAPARQEPLTEEQIKGGLFHAIDHATVYEAVAFKKGVRFAERALGITAAPAEGGAA